MKTNINPSYTSHLFAQKETFVKLLLSFQSDFNVWESMEAKILEGEKDFSVTGFPHNTTSEEKLWETVP